MRMRVAIIVVLTFFAGTPAFCGSIKSDYIGCKDKKVFDKLTSFLVEGDKDAFKKHYMVAAALGVCKMLKLGTQVYLEDTAIFAGLVCVRPKGEEVCYWTNSEAYDGK